MGVCPHLSWAPECLAEVETLKRKIITKIFFLIQIKREPIDDGTLKDELGPGLLLGTTSKT